MPELSSMVQAHLGLVVVVIIICKQTANGWPLGGASLYQCCCPDCKPECFSCRNTNFTCNCESCSCYSNNQLERPELEDPQTLIGKLLRTYSAKNQDRANRRRHEEHHKGSHLKQTKSHGRHGDSQSSASEGQDANRTKKRLAPPAADVNNKMNENVLVT